MRRDRYRPSPLSGLIAATVTLVTVAAAADIGDAKLYHSQGFNNLDVLRWASGVRLVIAGIALVLALVAGVRLARGLPATRYTFSADGEEAVESAEGASAPSWMLMLVGSSLVLSVLATAVNAIAFALTLHLHESPNFGQVPG